MDMRNGLRPDVRLGYFNNVVDSPAEARTAVRFLIKMGVDHIKINAGRGYRIKGRPILFAPEMREDVLKTIVEEAHTAGRKVAAHSLGSRGELWAVNAGVDSLEHAHFINDDTIQRMAEKGTFLVPTMTHCVRNTMDIRQKLPKELWPNDLILNAYDSMYRVIPKAFKLGVRIATGTDAGSDLVPHGCNAMELELLTTIGMTPMQAIVAATGSSAELLDMADLTGTIKKGHYADILIIRGDPLMDIRLLQDKKNILSVFKEGQLVVDQRN
jgi:imidazolonepropionase-like amidohydrolase